MAKEGRAHDRRPAAQRAVERCARRQPRTGRPSGGVEACGERLQVHVAAACAHGGTRAQTDHSTVWELRERGPSAKGGAACVRESRPERSVRAAFSPCAACA
eukprot:1748208-Prymnesium_polylepis.1